MEKIALIFGGVSTERMVSVASAQNLVKYFTDVECLFISSKGVWHQVSKEDLVSHQNPFKSEFTKIGEKVADNLFQTESILKNKTVFIALHGTEGEDGSFQKFFETNHIKYTGSGSTSSALCFDKVKSKKVAMSEKIPLAMEVVLNFNESSSAEKIYQFFEKNKKIVLKPVANGSSFGLYIIDNLEKLKLALAEISHFEDKYYLCEEFITGREITVGVYENLKGIKALCPSEVLLDKGAQFDYEGKYLGIGSKEITPANIDENEKRRCQELAVKAHRVFNCYGYSRTDMILTHAGPVFLETNTLPGMTKASFFPQQLEADGIAFQDFIADQIMMAKHRT